MKVKNFYYLDIYSPFVQIYHRGKLRKPTGVGLIFSIIIFLLSILVIIYSFDKWVKMTDMTINYRKYTLKEITQFPFNKLNVTINSMIFNDSNYLRTSYIYYNGSNLIDMEPKDCYSDEDFPNRFRCLNYSDNITLQAKIDNIDNSFNQYFQMLIIECPIYDDTCADYLDIMDKYQNQKFYVNILFTIPEIDHENRSNPISETLIVHTIDFDYSYQSTYTFNFNYLLYESDNGYLFEDKKKYYSIDFAGIERNEVSRDILEPIGMINFKLTKMNGEKYVRNFRKIQEVLSEIGGIISILNIICFSIVNLLTVSYSNYQIFEEVIEPFERKAAKNHSLKNNNLKLSDTVERFNQIGNSQIRRDRLLNSDIIHIFNCKNPFIIKSPTYHEKMNYCKIRKSKIFCDVQRNYLFKRSDQLVKKYLSADTIIGNLIKTEYFFNSNKELKGIETFFENYFEDKKSKSNKKVKFKLKSTINDTFFNGGISLKSNKKFIDNEISKKS